MLNASAPAACGSYLGTFNRVYARKWQRALLSTSYSRTASSVSVSGHRPDFASLFLNAGAHIQHHYMYDSACYQGPHRNPPGYVAAGCDPCSTPTSATIAFSATCCWLIPRPASLSSTRSQPDTEPAEGSTTTGRGTTRRSSRDSRVPFERGRPAHVSRLPCDLRWRGGGGPRRAASSYRSRPRQVEHLQCGQPWRLAVLRISYTDAMPAGFASTSRAAARCFNNRYPS